MKNWQFAVWAVLFASCAIGGRSANSLSVPVSQVRSAIDVYTCAVWSAEAQMWSLQLLSKDCATAAQDSDPVGTAVELAVREMRLLIPLGSRAYDYFYGKIEGGPRIDKRTADSLARTAFWQDPLLGRAFFLRLLPEFSTRKLQCEGCQVIPPPSRLEVTWREFFPYLLAYVWPTQPAPGKDIEVFVCSETNGSKSLPEAPALQQAGFLAAAALANNQTLNEEIWRITSSHNQKPQRSVEGLRGELDRFLQSPSHRAHICAAVSRTVWFTGVVVTDCTSA